MAMTEAQKRKSRRKAQKKWRKRNRERCLATARLRYQRNNTEEYRAKRRAKYAAKHANDPMTEFRAKLLATKLRKQQIACDPDLEMIEAKQAALKDIQLEEWHLSRKENRLPIDMEEFIREADIYFKLYNH